MPKGNTKMLIFDIIEVFCGKLFVSKLLPLFIILWFFQLFMFAVNSKKKVEKFIHFCNSEIKDYFSFFNKPYFPNFLPICYKKNMGNDYLWVSLESLKHGIVDFRIFNFLNIIVYWISKVLNLYHTLKMWCRGQRITKRKVEIFIILLFYKNLHK